jgi:hypothetical protein
LICSILERVVSGRLAAAGFIEDISWICAYFTAIIEAIIGHSSFDVIDVGPILVRHSFGELLIDHTRPFARGGSLLGFILALLLFGSVGRFAYATLIIALPMLSTTF